LIRLSVFIIIDIVLHDIEIVDFITPNLTFLHFDLLEKMINMVEVNDAVNTESINKSLDIFIGRVLFVILEIGNMDGFLLLVVSKDISFELIEVIERHDILLFDRVDFSETSFKELPIIILDESIEKERES